MKDKLRTAAAGAEASNGVDDHTSKSAADASKSDKTKDANSSEPATPDKSELYVVLPGPSQESWQPSPRPSSCIFLGRGKSWGREGGLKEEEGRGAERLVRLVDVASWC